MRQSPYEHEYQAAHTMRDNELLEYFLTRVFETDEVWFLSDRAGLMQRPIAEKTTIPVWPYRRFASEAALDYWQDYAPTSVSMEFFLEQTLPTLESAELQIEIMPRGHQAGCLISVKQLTSILQGLIDAGEYRLDA